MIWGGLHGLYLAAERTLRARFGAWRPGPLAYAALGLLTFALVKVAWVFFRAKTFDKAGLILSGMFGLNAKAVPLMAAISLLSTGAIVSAIVGAHWFMRNRTLEQVVARAHPALIAGVWTLMAFAVIIEHGTGKAFIYFQF